MQFIYELPVATAFMLIIIFIYIGVILLRLKPMIDKFDPTLESNETELRKRLTVILKSNYSKSRHHGWSHILEVTDTALKMRESLGLMYIPRYHVIMACFYHDMYSKSDRIDHHITARDYVYERGDYLLKKLEYSEIKSIGEAISSHRSSFIGDYYDKLAMLLAAADREKPVLDDIIIRSYKFAMDENVCNSSDKDLNASQIYYHLKDKYGVDGYARYNEYFTKMHGEEIETLTIAIENFTEETFKTYLFNLLKERKVK